MGDQHKEAFALMWYGCDCGHRERIWNSRDGVTPFGTACPSCGQVSLHHVDWHLDVRSPDYALLKGQRFWRDGTADEAVAVIERRIERFASSGHPIPADVAESLLADASTLSAEWRRGWPRLDRFEGEEASHA